MHRPNNSSHTQRPSRGSSSLGPLHAPALPRAHTSIPCMLCGHPLRWCHSRTLKCWGGQDPPPRGVRLRPQCLPRPNRQHQGPTRSAWCCSKVGLGVEERIYQWLEMMLPLNLGSRSLFPLRLLCCGNDKVTFDSNFGIDGSSKEQMVGQVVDVRPTYWLDDYDEAT